MPEFGTPHAKLIIVAWKHAVRVVVHTANLKRADLEMKTQVRSLRAIFFLMMSYII